MEHLFPNIQELRVEAARFERSFAAIAKGLRRSFNIDRASLTLYDPGNNQFELVALALHEDSELGKGWIIPHSASRAGAVFDSRLPSVGLLDNQGGFFEDMPLSKEGLRFAATVPLIADGLCFGTLNADIRADSPLPGKGLDLLCGIADLIATALVRPRPKASKAVPKAPGRNSKAAAQADIDQFSRFQGVVIRPSVGLALERMAAALNSDVTVLLVGETGTGKGVAARAIHDLSSRRAHAFLKCDCAAVSSQLIESELFGHEKGAFTGASGCHVGFFEQAGTGTLFLDEIGELSRGSQVKLLGALQDRVIQRVGGTASIPVNARVIAATNRDIEAEVSAGRLRSDLYHRLNVLKIELPPLRKTPEDLEPMTRHFLHVYSRAIGRRAPSISAEVLTAMREYPWPGNVRELEHFIQRSVLLSPSEIFEPKEFPDRRLSGNLRHTDSSARTLAEVEADHIFKVLEAANWRINGRNGAAKVLGLHPSTLRFRMARLNVRRPSRAIG